MVLFLKLFDALAGDFPAASLSSDGCFHYPILSVTA
jgi:hypothetical protein